MSSRAKHQHAGRSTLLSTAGHSPARDMIYSIIWPAGRRVESTVRYLGIEVDDALAIAEPIDI
jgi:hypothetical protein